MRLDLAKDRKQSPAHSENFLVSPNTDDDCLIAASQVWAEAEEAEEQTTGSPNPGPESGDGELTPGVTQQTRFL